MAKVSLRIYNREIESLIDQGNTNEAIAHCHHILRTFSKHLATYRLLGKAYLESKSYRDAVDIFGRVLMSVPDDFVAHVGMSIIHDEENKLDDSIWHMQRAFESQPSNPAIQGELQRLYGRRDGMEPPKIRMTRGALAQMYVQGELYPQAIAEIRAVLAEEPDRADMQVLLARAYFRGGQKADASDMCAQLLKRYLYCFDANRIMVDLLPATAGAVESTQVYRMRVGELDPYATFAKGSVFLSDEVADAAINLERLEYKEEEPQKSQEWGTSLGAGSGASTAPMLASTSSSDQPDWLKSGGFSDSQTSALASSQAAPMPDSLGASQSSDNIPDFLRDAGWGESNNPERPTSFFDAEPASGDLTPAEIPDWLKGQVPSDIAQPDKPQPAPEQSIETPDWLSGLSGAQAVESFDSVQPASAQSIDTPDWLSGLADSQTLESELTQSGNDPNSLTGFESSQASEPSPAQPGDVPDWLSGLGTSQSSTLEPAQPADVPDWLTGLDDSQTSEPAQAGNVPDWLTGLGDAESESAQPVDIPDWMRGIDSQNEPVQSGASIENLGKSAQEQDDAVAWLESLAAKHGARPEELVTDPNKRSETPPEWVLQAQNMDQQAPASQVPAPTVESLGSTAQEQDDAVAWLESLAAKHGAKPEELVTDPSKRFDTPPEWVSQAQSIGEAQSASALLNAEEEKSSLPSESVENELNIGEQSFAEFENASTSPAPIPSLANDETGMWLRDLEEKEKQEEFSAQPASDGKGASDWFSDSQPQPEQPEEQNLRRSDIPDWLNDSQQPQNISSQFDFIEPEPATEKSDLPDWLGDVEEKPTEQDTFANQDMPQSDLSNWLSGLDDEPGLPFDEIPTPDSILISSMPATPTKKPAGPEPAASKSDLPDWLNDVDSQGEGPEDEWKKSIAQEPIIPASELTEEPIDQTQDKPVPVNLTENLPDWLQSMDEEEAAKVDDEPAPWLHQEEFEAKEAQQPKPTSPSDWHPVEPQQPISAPVEKKETLAVEARKPFAPQEVPPAEPFEQVQPPAERPVETRIPAKKKSGLLAKQRQPEAQNVTVALNQAKGELDRGDIPTALEHYKKLIKKGKHLEETIRDLTESIYRYPVEVGIWQTLGDAYMRANRLKEALEAYNKAEELIR